VICLEGRLVYASGPLSLARGEWTSARRVASATVWHRLLSLKLGEGLRPLGFSWDGEVMVCR
jgi:hypothetical protein